MIEKITMCLCAENRTSFIEIPQSELKLQSKLDIVIADTFSKIVGAQQSVKDDAIRTAEKFKLAQTLNNYWEEMNRNDDTTRPN